MQLRFVSRELAALDELDVEVLVASVFSDVRPAQGVAALCDWRLGAMGRRGSDVAREAADIVLSEAEHETECDAWTLVEDVEARAAMEQHAAERRRRRRVLTD